MRFETKVEGVQKRAMALLIKKEAEGQEGRSGKGWCCAMIGSCWAQFQGEAKGKERGKGALDPSPENRPAKGRPPSVNNEPR